MLFREVLKKYTYYALIALLVAIALIFMPMLDSSGALGFQLPNSPLGVVAYIITRCLVGVIVFLIFVSFDSQGKLNVLEHPSYLEAFNLLNSLEVYEYIPMSPKAYKTRTYCFKAVSLSLSMTLTAFVMMEMILSYNYIILITYVITILMSIITGIFQMKKAEIYWTEEYLKWAKYIVRKEKEKQTCLLEMEKNSEI